MRRDDETVADMVLACQRMLDFTAGMGREAFVTDAKTQSAVIHQLLIVGEAVGRLSEEFCRRHQRIPWRQVRAMRNHLVHLYDDVDLEEVWQTVERDVPELLRYLRSVEGDGT